MTEQPAAGDANADILVIGAGAGGGVAARRLAEGGFSVVALEQGQWQDRLGYRGTEWDWELTAQKQWSSLPGVRQGPSDYPIDLTESDMAVLNFNGVGGGTVLFNAIWNRLPPSVFEERSRFGLGDDWPISYAELEPYYDRADREVGVSGLGGNPAYPLGAEPPLPSLPFGPGAVRVARALAARGWHWWPDTNAIISTNYDGRYQCVQRGTCYTGCNEGAKSSIDLTHWKRFEALGGRLKTGARVRRITVGDDGLATGAEWVDAEGRVHFQSAGTVLVAANGIGTPRLLLASACDRFPDGLCNSSGLVGRRLMMHPLAVVFGFFPDHVEGWLGQNGSTVQCLEFGQDDPARGHRGGTKWALHPPSSGGPLGEAMKVLASGAPASEFHARHAERFGKSLMWSIMCGDQPEEGNRVVLSPDLIDAAGVPAAKIIYRTSENSRRALTYNVERASQIFRDAGACKIEAYDPAGANAHLMGTARMGDDPATSVVDRWAMSHDIPNLGVIDGSVFVTSGPVNPTSTITALALRTADRLVARRGSLPTSSERRRSYLDVASVSPGAAPATAAVPLSAEEIQRLACLGDALIPAVDALPAAGRMILSPGALQRVLDVRPDLLPPLHSALAVPCEAAPADRLETLRTAAPAEWQAIATVVAGTYFADPAVRVRIGYSGQEPRPQQPDRNPAYIEEGLLDHMIADEWRAAWGAAGSPRQSVAAAMAEENG